MTIDSAGKSSDDIVPAGIESLTEDGIDMMCSSNPEL